MQHREHFKWMYFKKWLILLQMHWPLALCLHNPLPNSFLEASGTKAYSRYLPNFLNLPVFYSKPMQYDLLIAPQVAPLRFGNKLKYVLMKHKATTAMGLSKRVVRRSVSDSMFPFSQNVTHKRNNLKGKPLGSTVSLLAHGATNVQAYRFSTSAINSIQLLGSWRHTSELPNSETPEVAFLGRSNVGKSSLINCLIDATKAARSSRTGARISKTPGCTQTINMYSFQDRRKRCLVVFTDLPGYGYAKNIPVQDIKIMKSFTQAYIHRRNALRLIVLLVDSRSTEVQRLDAALLKAIRKTGVPYTVVATKCDKISSETSNIPLQPFKKQLFLPSWMPIESSSVTGKNINLLWSIIRDACVGEYDHNLSQEE